MLELMARQEEGEEEGADEREEAEEEIENKRDAKRQRRADVLEAPAAEEANAAGSIASGAVMAHGQVCARDDDQEGPQPRSAAAPAQHETLDA